MKNKSIWQDEIKYNNSKCCKKEKIENVDDVDILIIGAGITGLTLAYFLKDLDKKVIVIDKGKVMSGVTCKTTAKLSFVQQDIYQKLNCWYGNSVVRLYYDSQIEGITLIKQIINANKIECDFKEVDSILFALKDNEVNKVKKEENILKKFGVKTYKVEDKNIKYGIRLKDNYVFHPLKYLNGIKDAIDSKIKIYENVLAMNINSWDDGYLINTSAGDIKAKNVVMACHYPFQIFPGLIPVKTHVKKEYVNAARIKEKDIKDVAALNIGKELHSIRYYNDYVIYGSHEHRTTTKIDYKRNYDKSKEEFKKYFNVEPEYTWMNQDVISNDHLPFIGKVKDGVYIATGYNAWGMTNGTIAAKLIADLIEGKENKYEKIFKPKRINMCLVLNSAFGLLCYLKSYVEGLFHKNNPSYVKIDDVIYGIYTDEKGAKHKVKLICPHMTCSLVFNEEEKTWDCPCHGSRFDIDGNIIEGPAKHNINESKK